MSNTEHKIDTAFSGKARQGCIEGECGDFREKVTNVAHQFLHWIAEPPTEVPEFQDVPFTYEDIARQEVEYFCDGPVYDEDEGKYHCGLVVTTTLFDLNGKSLATTSFQTEETIQ